MADATRALPGNRHDDPSSLRPAKILGCSLDYRTGGSLLESRPGSILESAEGKYLEKHFPALYLASLNRARNFCGIPASQDGLEPEDKPKSRSRKKHKG